MKIYTAALFSEQKYMMAVNQLIREAGHDTTARWIFPGATNDQEVAALECWTDVATADAVVLFTQPKGTLYKGGGRMVEFGIAIGLGKKLFVVGDMEMVFCHLPSVTVFRDRDAFLNYLRVTP